VLLLRSAGTVVLGGARVEFRARLLEDHRTMQLEKGGPQGDESGRCPVSAIGGAFNPFVDPYLADPYPFWRNARRTEPVFYSPEIDCWVVTRFDDIKAIFADPESFSAGNAQNPIIPIAPEVVELLSGGLKTKPTMSNADPPAHTRIRKSTWRRRESPPGTLLGEP
jgi:hypothetical protein